MSKTCRTNDISNSNGCPVFLLITNFGINVIMFASSLFILVKAFSCTVYIKKVCCYYALYSCLVSIVLTHTHYSALMRMTWQTNKAADSEHLLSWFVAFYLHGNQLHFVTGTLQSWWVGGCSVGKTKRGRWRVPSNDINLKPVLSFYLTDSHLSLLLGLNDDIPACRYVTCCSLAEHFLTVTAGSLNDWKASRGQMLTLHSLFPRWKPSPCL